MSAWASQGVWLLAVASIELCVLTGVVWVATWVGRQWSSATKQLLWTAVLAKPVLVILLALTGVSFLPATGINSDEVMRSLGKALGSGGVAATDPQGGLLTAAWLPIVLLVLWFIGLLGSLTVLVGGVVASTGLVRRSYDCGFRLSPAFLRRLGVIAPANVDVIVTDLATSPGSHGLFRSTILLPIDWLPIQQNGRLGPDDAVALRHVLEHEIYHVRRHDGLYQFVLRLIAAPLWFHPLSYVIIRKWIDVIEIAVDARVLSDGYIDRTQYAKTLISAVRRSIPTRVAAGTWFLGHSRRRAVRVLHRRLHTVLTPPKRLSHWSRIASLACAIAVLTSFPVTVVSVRSPQSLDSTNEYATANGIPTHYYWRGEVVSYAQLPPLQQEQVRQAYTSYDGPWTLSRNLRPVVGKLDASLLITDWNTAYRTDDGRLTRFASGNGLTLSPGTSGVAADMPIPVPAPRP